MANTLYDKGREAFLSASISWSADTIKAVLVDTGTYTFSQAHQFLSSLSGTVGTAATLGTKTVTSGVADAADVTYTAVTGASVEAIVIYKDTGVAGTSPLIAYIDTATNLPVTPNGGDISITWDNGTNKIFKL
jgi:predicted dehydrogenase